jgi:ribosomal protein L37AE/L43A
MKPIKRCPKCNKRKHVRFAFKRYICSMDKGGCGTTFNSWSGKV